MTSPKDAHSTVRLNLVTRLNSLRQLFIRLLPELSKFGIVGLLALLVDVGGFNLLRFSGGEGPLYQQPLTAKIVSGAAATVVSWLGNRYWTFRDTRRSAVHHELFLFVVACTIGTAIAVGCLAISHYVLGFTSPLDDNISTNVVGLVLGTAFRFWAYRTFVFVQDQPADGAERVETASQPRNWSE
jgi:putative flippase GtrA